MQVDLPKHEHQYETRYLRNFPFNEISCLLVLQRQDKKKHSTLNEHLHCKTIKCGDTFIL